MDPFSLLLNYWKQGTIPNKTFILWVISELQHQLIVGLISLFGYWRFGTFQQFIWSKSIAYFSFLLFISPFLISALFSLTLLLLLNNHTLIKTNFPQIAVIPQSSNHRHSNHNNDQSFHDQQNKYFGIIGHLYFITNCSQSQTEQR